MNNESFILKSNPEVYWALGFISALLIGLGWYFDASFLKWIFYVLGGLCMFATASDWLIYNKSVISLDKGELNIYRGIFRKHEHLQLADVRQALIFKEREDATTDFELFDLDNPDQVSLIKSLKVITHSKEVEFNRYEYDPDCFLEFLRRAKTEIMEATATPEEKIEAVFQKCNQYIQHDTQLVRELNENMHEAYRSVYQSYLLQAREAQDKKKLEAPEVAYYYAADASFYYYYRHNEYKNGIDESMVQIAQNLIHASKHNISIAQMRLEYYKKIQQRLQRLKEQYIYRLQLKSVAERLNNLQQRNFKKNTSGEESGFDAGLLVQLDTLAHRIQQTETIEQSQVLKEHAQLFQQYFEDDHLLGEINERLG